MLWLFGCIISLTFEDITIDLGVSPMESITMIDKPVIKEFKKLLASIVDYTVNTTTWLECGL